MEKPKQASTTFPFLAFLFGQPIDFVSLLPPDECARRLGDKSERGNNGLIRNRNKLKVTVQQLGTGRYTFKLERDAGRNLNVEVEGQLIAEGENRTQVLGRARISRMVYVLVAIIIPLQIVLFGLISPPLMLLPLIVVLFLWGLCVVERNKLERIVYNTLSDQLF